VKQTRRAQVCEQPRQLKSSAMQEQQRPRNSCTCCVLLLLREPWALQHARWAAPTCMCMNSTVRTPARSA
jgi:hypothetical protein